jgi:hypothetical protein
MNIQLKVTGAGKDSCVSDNATAIDLDVIIDGKYVCGVTVVADHERAPAMHGDDWSTWCSDGNALAWAYTERAEAEFEDGTEAAEVYDRAIELAEADIMTALSELLDTNEAPMYWSGGFWTGLEEDKADADDADDLDFGMY